MYLEKVSLTDILDFRQIVDASWQELMPHRDVVKHPDRREAYFRECFTWAGGNRHPYGAVAEGGSVGFVAYAVDEARTSASIDDVYGVPEARRRGSDAAMVQAVYAQLDPLGVELVELNVRRDDPPDVFPLLQERYRVRHEQAMLRRVLAPGCYRPVVPKGVSRLGSTDLETVQSLYADGEATGEAPDCFMPAMLEHGVDDGVYEGDWLIAAAGTHGVAPTVSVGALGHVYTRCDRRGRGLASRVTSAVTSHLWDMKSSTVVLNVRENNRAAIRVDEQLGFQTRCHSYEAIAAR